MNYQLMNFETSVKLPHRKVSGRGPQDPTHSVPDFSFLMWVIHRGLGTKHPTSTTPSTVNSSPPGEFN